MNETETPEHVASASTVESPRGRRLPTRWALITAAALVVGGVAGFGISAAASAGDGPKIAALKSDLGSANTQNAALLKQQIKVEAEQNTLDAEKTTLATEKAKLDEAAATLDANTFAGDGTFVVGKDIQPGTYKAAASPGCYWARLSDLSGGVSGILANDNADGPVVVAILPSDVAFTDAGCGSFTKIG